MHELSIATGIVESVLGFAEVHQAGKVLKVRLLIGELMCVANEQLQFCYHSVIQETELEDSTLEIETMPAAVKCSHCAYHGPAHYRGGDSTIPTLQCPGCGKTASVTQGRECAIRTIQCLQPEQSSFRVI